MEMTHARACGWGPRRWRQSGSAWRARGGRGARADQHGLRAGSARQVPLRDACRCAPLALASDGSRVDLPIDSERGVRQRCSGAPARQRPEGATCLRVPSYASSLTPRSAMAFNALVALDALSGDPGCVRRGGAARGVGVGGRLGGSADFRDGRRGRHGREGGACRGCGRARAGGSARRRGEGGGASGGGGGGAGGAMGGATGASGCISSASEAQLPHRLAR